MKAKALKILLLAVAIIICLSVALYAAHSFSQAKATPTVSVAEDGGTKILVPIKETDRSVLRKAR